VATRIDWLLGQIDLGGLNLGISPVNRATSRGSVDDNNLLALSAGQFAVCEQKGCSAKHSQVSERRTAASQMKSRHAGPPRSRPQDCLLLSLRQRVALIKENKQAAARSRSIPAKQSFNCSDFVPIPFGSF
jgi:hypothetical protein